MASPRPNRRSKRALLWAFCGSTVVHALLIVLLLWLAARFFVMPKPSQESLVVTSSSVRLERRTVPQPKSVAGARPARVHATLPSAAAKRPTPEASVRPEPPRELARLAPTAPPQPPRSHPAPARKETFGEQLAEQQRAFSKDVARLNASNNPRSIATMGPQAPSAYRKSYYDLNGKKVRTERATVLITPSEHWISGANSCYYVHYAADYDYGGSDEGDIPWPVCYPRKADPIALAPPGESVPVPAPLPQSNYVLPVGTYLTPLMRSVYNMRTKATPAPTSH